MRTKIIGGNFYKFDLFTLGKLSFEREYNKLLIIKSKYLNKLNNVDAFIHSFDFTSNTSNIFNRPNIFRFIKNNIQDSDLNKFNYFLINIKKNICKYTDFINLLDSIIKNVLIIKLSKNRFNALPDSEIYNMFDNLIYNIIQLCDFIKFDNLIKKDGLLNDYLNNNYNINNEDTITIDSNGKTTDEFLVYLKKTYAKYNDKKGGAHKDEEYQDEEYQDEEYQDDLRYLTIEHDYLSYDEIIDIFNQKSMNDTNFLITDYYIGNFTYILGFINIFRYSGLFESKDIKMLNNIFHLLQYYPYNYNKDVQNKFINRVFSNTAKILLKLAEMLLKHCNDYAIQNTSSRTSPRAATQKKSPRAATRSSSPPAATQKKSPRAATQKKSPRAATRSSSPPAATRSSSPRAATRSSSRRAATQRTSPPAATRSSSRLRAAKKSTTDK